MGKKKGKKSLSRRARLELRARQEGREAREIRAKRRILKVQTEARLAGDKALRREDRFNFETVLKNVGWNSISRDKNSRFRSLAIEAWHKRPGLLARCFQRCDHRKTPGAFRP